MKYISTRDTREFPEKISSAEAIKRGLAPDGGLYLPEFIPTIDLDFISAIANLPYNEAAVKVLSLFLDDYTEEELREDASNAYGERFGNDPAPVAEVKDGLYSLELWHGPTCAFKDMALQIMPRLLSRALVKTGEKRTSLVLVATSGDTGKAALEGYRDVSGIKIKVFYPVEGVSRVQKLQMMTQQGSNVDVCAIKGNFDDAQTGVKKIFSDKKMSSELDEKGYFLSSANSINWGRLAPQIVYYFVGYGKIIKSGKIKCGDEIDVAVPTGNFGNILAAFIAKKMGLPIRKLICASNSNNILSDFLSTGVYDRNRIFHTTMSPSMDILISSNLERLIYLCSNATTTLSLMQQLTENGKYVVSDDILKKISSTFCGFYANEAETAFAIKSKFVQNGYLSDTHTAVAFSCVDKYVALNKEKTLPIMVASTASPYKFAADVLRSIDPTVDISDEYQSLSQLSDATKGEIPSPLAELDKKIIRFDRVISPDQMSDDVISHL